jgi:hypothetical protein
MNLVAKHETYFLQAVEAHQEFDSLIRKAKVRAFDAGLLLLSARKTYEDAHPGEWFTYLESQADKMSRTTYYRYTKFAGDCLEWAQADFPQLKDPKKLQTVARDLVLQSALSFMELVRELGIIRAREGGGRRSENHNPQTEFNFDYTIFDDSLWALEKQGVEGFKDVPAAKLQETCTRLEHALQLTKQALETRTAALPVATEMTKLSPGPELPWWFGYVSAEGRITVLPMDAEVPESMSMDQRTRRFQAEDELSATVLAKHIFALPDIAPTDEKNFPIADGVQTPKHAEQAPTPASEPDEEADPNWPWFWGYQNIWGGIHLKASVGADSLREQCDCRMSPSAYKVIGSFQAHTLDTAEAKLRALIAANDPLPDRQFKQLSPSVSSAPQC